MSSFKIVFVFFYSLFVVWLSLLRLIRQNVKLSNVVLPAVARCSLLTLRAFYFVFFFFRNASVRVCFFPNIFSACLCGICSLRSFAIVRIFQRWNTRAVSDQLNGKKWIKKPWLRRDDSAKIDTDEWKLMKKPSLIFAHRKKNVKKNSSFHCVCTKWSRKI